MPFKNPFGNINKEKTNLFFNKYGLILIAIVIVIIIIIVVVTFVKKESLDTNTISNNQIPSVAGVQTGTNMTIEQALNNKGPVTEEEIKATSAPDTSLPTEIDKSDRKLDVQDATATVSMAPISVIAPQVTEIITPNLNYFPPKTISLDPNNEPNEFGESLNERETDLSLQIRPKIILGSAKFYELLPPPSITETFIKTEMSHNSSEDEKPQILGDKYFNIYKLKNTDKGLTSID